MDKFGDILGLFFVIWGWISGGFTHCFFCFGEKEAHAHAHIWTDLIRILGMVAVYGGVPSDGLGDIQGAE